MADIFHREIGRKTGLKKRNHLPGIQLQKSENVKVHPIENMITKAVKVLLKLNKKIIPVPKENHGLINQKVQNRKVPQIAVVQALEKKAVIHLQVQANDPVRQDHLTNKVRAVQNHLPDLQGLHINRAKVIQNLHQVVQKNGVDVNHAFNKSGG